MAKHHSAQQWRMWFLEFGQSELTVSEFRKSVGVSVRQNPRDRPSSIGLALHPYLINTKD